jgi:hypothetical protein
MGYLNPLSAQTVAKIGCTISEWIAKYFEGRGRGLIWRKHCYPKIIRETFFLYMTKI